MRFTPIHYGAYIPAEGRVDVRFLWWLLRSNAFREILQQQLPGGIKMELKAKRLLRVPVPMPALAEQCRIVARIEELAAKIEEARGLRRKAVEEASALWESSLASVFADLAEKHPSKRFEEICDVVRGGSPRPAGNPEFYDGPIPFLKVADLTKDDTKFVTTYTASIKEAGLQKTRFVEADTLMLTNSGATLGVPKICTFETCFNDGIQAFLNISGEVSKEYLYYFFRSKTRWFREWVARGQGQPNLNTSMVKTMEFPYLPLAEQHRIVVYLDDLQAKVDAVKRLQAETSAELEALLPSVLDRAFKGEL